MKNKHFLNELEDMVRNLKQFNITEVTKTVNPRKYELMCEEFKDYPFINGAFTPLIGELNLILFGVKIKILVDKDWFKNIQKDED